eukprot:scaffold1374_cov175-Amphora_coffeaeformis.AAC.2
MTTTTTTTTMRMRMRMRMGEGDDVDAEKVRRIDQSMPRTWPGPVIHLEGGKRTKKRFIQ